MHGAFSCLDDVECVACRNAAGEAEEQVDGNQAFYPKSVDFIPPQITLVDRNQRVKKEFQRTYNYMICVLALNSKL